jgi:hypothetical protein
MRAELFVIEPGIWRNTQADDCRATCEALEQLNCYHLPYEAVTVRIPAREFLTFNNRPPDQYPDLHAASDVIYVDITVNEDVLCEPKVVCFNQISGFAIDVTHKMTISFADKAYKTGQAWLDEGAATALYGIHNQVRDFIITLLATRNAIKRTTVDKLAKLGIGKKKYKHRFTHTTTISLPRPEDMEDDHEHKPTGLHRAPHLRRGHIRHQHYGPKNTYVKRVWIAPVFVNADPDFVSAREGYNVTTRTERTDERTRQSA